MTISAVDDPAGRGDQRGGRFPELESLDHDRLHMDPRLKKAVVANAGQRPRRS